MSIRSDGFLHRELDREAGRQGRRAAADLLAKHAPEQIPFDAVAIACAAFETGARRALADSGVPGELDALLQRLVERWAEAAAVELRRRAASDGRTA